MTSIEQTGKDIEEATQLALEQLGVTEDEVDVEILEDGGKGFLGLGQAPAKVRVTVRKARPAAKAPSSEKSPEPRPKRQPKPKPEAKPQKEAPPAPPPEAAPMGLEDTIKQAAEISREVLQRILEGISEGGKAVVKSTAGDQVELDMVGGDTAILIGKHGQTIDSLQYLVGVITNKRLTERIRIVIDAEGYRGRREDALRKQALFFARQVKDKGEEAVLESLHANERRIIHMTLADDPEVYTYSEGEDPDRHVVISPKK